MLDTLHNAVKICHYQQNTTSDGVPQVGISESSYSALSTPISWTIWILPKLIAQPFLVANSIIYVFSMSSPRAAKSGYGKALSSAATTEGPDLNSIIQLVAWLLLAVTSLMFLFRLLTRFFIKSGKSFSREDAFILKIFGLGESIIVGLPQSRILGKDLDKILPNELEGGLKVRR
ncbi:hypothetical protein F4824DRAFT_440548 [Ustulina deusta]|nr:hypothetical protein F4824DRAFT_440548 [Ustulina deusta]